MTDALLRVTCELADKGKKLTWKQWEIISSGLSELCTEANISCIASEVLDHVNKPEDKINN